MLILEQFYNLALKESIYTCVCTLRVRHSPTGLSFCGFACPWCLLINTQCMWPRVTSIFQTMTFKESLCLHWLQYMSVAIICTMCVSMWCSCAMFCLPFPPQVNIWAPAMSLLSWVMPLRASYASLGVNKPRFLPGRYWGGERLVWGLGLQDGILPALSFSSGGGVCFG